MLRGGAWNNNPDNCRAARRNNNTPDWAYRVVNLSAYAGRTVALQFRATTDGSLNSNLLIDDVAFNNATTVRAAPAPFRWPARPRTVRIPPPDAPARPAKPE